MGRLSNAQTVLTCLKDHCSIQTIYAERVLLKLEKISARVKYNRITLISISLLYDKYSDVVIMSA